MMPGEPAAFIHHHVPLIYEISELAVKFIF